MKILSVSALVLAGFQAALATPLTLWPHDETKEHSDARRALLGERLSNQRLSSISTAHFFSTDSLIYDELVEGRSIEFGIPEVVGTLERKECFLRSGNPVVPRALQNKYADTLKMFHCVTDQNEELTITIDTSRADGMSAVFFGKDRRTFYVDSVFTQSTHYIIYDAAIGAREGIAPEFATPDDFEDSALFEELAEEAAAELIERGVLERVTQSADFPAYKFKLAPLANRFYSSFHGNTKESVLAAIIECFTRVNGVYTNELGVFFELVDNADLGICLDGDSRSACNRLSNTGSVINSALSTLEDLGIDADTFDIGHVLTTGSGGVAYLGSLCSRTNKARGTTGLREPYTDTYFIDYVAHEIGHQLLGGHSFRDCNGPRDSQLSKTSASEPGSASSIMGYAGICGNNNIQTFSDPYFNNLNQQQMRDFVVGVASEPNCGESMVVGPTLPQVSAVDECRVPLGNFFQLKGKSNSADNENTFFSWDRVDPVVEDFSSSSLGSFRSWKPTRAKSRILPNLHALNFPSSTSAKVEKLPTSARDMTFRFTERRTYKTEAVADFFLETTLGDFVYTDTTVEFINSAPISIVSPAEGSSFAVGEEVTVEWTGNGQNVEVAMAVNTLEDVERDFDYERDNQELQWIVLASAPVSAGKATFTVPAALAGADVNLMVRSTFGDDPEGCYFFDLVTELAVDAAAVNDVPDAEDATNKESNILLYVAGVCISAAVVLGVLDYKLRKKETAAQEEVTASQTEVQKVKPVGNVAVQNQMFAGEDQV